MKRPLSQDEIPVYEATEVLLTSYASRINKPSPFEAVWEIIGDSSGEFLDRVEGLDACLAQNPEFQELEEVLFDLLLVKFLSTENRPDDYFDTPEWEQIENKTIDRGTELLNLFLYIIESIDTDVDISLDDFLQEFLLIEETEFQDELRIYESFIVNEDILDAEISDLKEIQEGIQEDNPIKSLFVPMVLFFQVAEEIEPELGNALTPFEDAVYHSVLAFYGE